MRDQVLFGAPHPPPPHAFPVLANYRQHRHHVFLQLLHAEYQP